MKSINPIDKSNLRQVILDFPKQFRGGVEAAAKVKVPAWQLRSPIVLCGVGGSASVGDLLKLWLRHEYLGFSEFEVIVHRDYNLPKLERKTYGDGVWEPFIIAISYSGNTEETLSAYNAAKKKSLPLVAVSTGGKLKARAIKDGVPFVQIPQTGIQPRSSFGYQFGALVGILSKVGVLSHETKKAAQLESALDPRKSEKEGMRIARILQNTVPLIYTSASWKELAHIIKIKFNEHAKWPAFWNYFPELNHNEMTGFAGQGAKQKAQGTKFHAVIFRDKADHPRVQKRMVLTARLLAQKGVKSTLIPIEGASTLEKMFSTILLGDWMAYYHAILRGIDPTPVKMVEEFKKLMK